MSWVSGDDGAGGGVGGKKGSVEGIAMRLDLSMTILLTAVAFKFVTVSFLPQISYLTLIDKFVLMCMAFLVLVFTIHTIAGVLLLAEVGNDVIAIIDWAFLGLLCMLYVLKLVWLSYVSKRAKATLTAGVSRERIINRAMGVSSRLSKRRDSCRPSVVGRGSDAAALASQLQEPKGVWSRMTQRKSEPLWRQQPKTRNGIKSSFGDRFGKPSRV